MKSVSFRFNLDEKVTVVKTNLTGIVTLCAIQGDPEHPENTYYVSGATGEGWYAERLLKEAD